MCYGCFEGEEWRLTPAAAEAAQRIRAIYEVHPAGGDAHIVTDDWNLNDENIQWCLDNGQQEDGLARSALLAMQALSLPERVAALALADGFITAEGDLA